MDERRVRYEVSEGVGVITLDRPDKHNAMDNAMSEELRSVVDGAIDDPSARALVLRGEGRSFSSGRDTTQLGLRPGGESDYAFVMRAQVPRLRLLEAPKPVLAVLKGAVLGGAFELALSADFRIADTTVRMGFPEAEMGIMTDTGGAPLTTMLAGPSRAKWLIMTSERIDAQQALGWGLVDWVVEPAELDDRAMALAAKLAAGPPLALAMIKQVVDQAWAGAVRRGIGAELLAQSVLFRSDDRAEARTARTEGRPPQFKGV